MKIAYIVPSLVNKGPIIVANTLIRHLIGRVDVIDVYYFDEIYGLNFTCPTYKIDFDKPIDFDKYDIIHSHMYRPDKYVVRWKGEIRKAKIVTTIHQDIFANLRYSYNIFVALIYTPLWLRILRKFDVAIAISSKVKTLYQNKLNNIFVIYNGVDIVLNPTLADEKIMEEIHNFRKSGLKILGTYAALTPRKGVEQILRLMAKRSDLAFVVIGEGNVKEHLIREARKLSISDRVLFLPYLPHPYNYVPLFDLYVMPSRSEGFGLALVEAAMAKASVVCSDIDVFREIFNEDEVSYFSLDDLVSLSSAIDSAQKYYVEKSEKAYERAYSDFNGQNMALHYLQLYKSLI